MPALPLCETVNHSWRYEKALCFHLSTYLLHPPQSCRVRVTIFYCPDDIPVVATLGHFCELAAAPDFPPTVEWNFRELDQPRLCRRAIGRNLAAKETAADFLLFGDIDYLFGPGAIDAIAAGMRDAAASGPPMICWPRYVQSSIDHAAGDAELARVADGPQVVDVDPSRYQPVKLGRGIGGAQWVLGDWARENGYLPTSRRYQRPVRRWARTFEDRVFRCTSGLRPVELSIPNVFRIRHARRGRTDIGCRN
jgi:hypothetical protein